jgi:hypothetical protein
MPSRYRTEKNFDVSALWIWGESDTGDGNPARTSSVATETTPRDALRVATRLLLIPVAWVMCRVIANDDFVKRDLDELIDNLHGSLRDAASVTRRMTLHRLRIARALANRKYRV